MCEFCESEIYKDSEGNFFLEVDSSHWDDFYECYDKVELSGIKYCPFCGRELGDEDEDN